MSKKKILIIDETRSSRICSAILESEGFGTEVLADSTRDLPGRLERKEFGLVITSYPYGNILLKEIKKRQVPMIILADGIDWDLIKVLESFSETFCMLKPLNFQKFTSVVKQVMSGDYNLTGGYNIV